MMRPSEAQRRINRIVESDPAGLTKLGRLTKSGRVDSQYNHYIYVLLVIIPALLLLSFGFYILAEVDGLISGTPDDEIQMIIEDRIKAIVNEAEYNETLIETAKVRRNGNHMNKELDAFDALNPFINITFGFKVVPPISSEYNALGYLMQRMSLVSGTEGDHELYDRDTVGDLDSETASPKYFKWDRWWLGADSFQFATLKFDE
jgi:hypothetical protein